MKFKLDENFSPKYSTFFREHGHDAETVWSENMSGATDELVYGKCCEEARCLVTMDLDFANPLRFDPAGTNGIVVIRPKLAVESHFLPLLRQLLLSAEILGLPGKLWIVEPGRIRVHAPLQDPGPLES